MKCNSLCHNTIIMVSLLSNLLHLSIIDKAKKFFMYPWIYLSNILLSNRLFEIIHQYRPSLSVCLSSDFLCLIIIFIVNCCSRIEHIISLVILGLLIKCISGIILFNPNSSPIPKLNQSLHNLAEVSWITYPIITG